MGSCVISIICRAPLIELVVKSRAKQPTRCVSNSVRQYPHTVCFCAESAKIIPLTVHGKSSCSYQSSIVPTTYTTRAALKWVLTQSTLRGQSIPLRYTSRFTSTRVAEEVARPGALLPQAQAQAQQPARDRPSSRSTRHYAVLGAGFAGVATAFHLLQQGSLYNPVHVQIFDPAGIAGGASGAAAGLLHPFSPRGRPLWAAEEAIPAAEQLLAAAQAASSNGEPFVWRPQLLRPAADKKQAEDLRGAPFSAAGVTAQLLEPEEAQEKFPGLQSQGLPSLLLTGGAVVDPRKYLRALWAACVAAAAQRGGSAMLRSEHIASLAVLEASEGPWTAVIVATGAATTMLPEVANSLPVDIQEGFTLQLSPPPSQHMAGGYPPCAPSVLGRTYIAAHGERRLVVGASKGPGKRLVTPQKICGRSATTEESHTAATFLLPAAAAVWDPATEWTVDKVNYGVRAMAQRSNKGAPPLAGRLRAGAEDVSESTHRWWIVTGLGARGLVYHAWLGQLLAQAVVTDDETVLPAQLTRWKTTAAVL